MAFRIVSIEHSSELHVANGQLRVVREDAECTIPLSDIIMVVCMGANIRISTMALGLLAESSIMVLILGRNHMPQSMVVPMVSNARQAKVTAAQVAMTRRLRDEIWQRIVKQKILNQARALAIAGLDGAEVVSVCARCVLPGDKGNAEGAAAREYFQFLHPGLNRRCDDPFNSALNYGYAIVRALVARALVITGFIPAIGIHHRSQLNAFNLADDLIEPFRPVVDLVARQHVDGSLKLSAVQRSEIRKVAFSGVSLGGRIVSLADAVEASAVSLKHAVEEGSAKLLLLPMVIPPSSVSPVKE